MKLFKPTFKSKQTGGTKTCSHWYLSFVDKMQVRRRLPAFVNQRATERAAEKIEELLSAGDFLRPELQAWLEKEIPPKMRERLVAWGVVDSRRISSRLAKSLEAHVEDFRLTLAVKDGATHAGQVARTLGNIFVACGFRTWGDLDGHSLYTYLDSLRGADGIGERTFNAYLKAAKHFARWMVLEQRATASPLEHLECIRQTEKRRQRRALDLDEQRRLLTTTAGGPTHHNLTGPERVLVYRLALEAGLRANEIRQLTVEAFDFDDCTVSLPSAYTKNRKAAVLALRPQTVTELKAHLAGRLPHEIAFAMPDQGVRMIRRDLEAAGIPYKTSEGQADFHALRHSFITNLARAGVHPSDAQALARHGSITLTMNCYTHPRGVDLTRIVNDMPDLASAPGGLSQACHARRSA